MGRLAHLAQLSYLLFFSHGHVSSRYRLNSFRLGPQPMVPLVLGLLWGMCGPHVPLFPDDVAEKRERVQSWRKQGPTAGRMGLMGRLAHLAQLSYLLFVSQMKIEKIVIKKLKN